MQNQVRRQITAYSHPYKSLTYAVGHDAEQNHKQITTRPLSSDRAVSLSCAARELGRPLASPPRWQRQGDEDNTGRNSGNI